jgi:hypothetical protein
MRKTLALLGLLLLAGAVTAQESASFKLEEHTFNAGGDPTGGAAPTSTNFRISLDSVGDSVIGSGLSSTSFNLDACFLAAYPPPGEVLNLVLLADDMTLEWAPEKSAGIYNLYRDVIGNLSGTDYGDCEEQDITDETTTDITSPTPAEVAFYYLVTVENRLGEEGVMGVGTPGSRPNNFACP